MNDIFVARVCKRDQIRYVDFAAFSVYGKTVFNVGHLHFVNLYTCPSRIKDFLYLLVIGSQRLILKAFSQLE